MLKKLKYLKNNGLKGEGASPVGALSSLFLSYVMKSNITEVRKFLEVIEGIVDDSTIAVNTISGKEGFYVSIDFEIGTLLEKVYETAKEIEDKGYEVNVVLGYKPSISYEQGSVFSAI